MGFYTVNHTGTTIINEGTEEEPKPRKIKYAKDEPVTDVKKGALDHVAGAEYEKGEPKEKAKKKS